MHENKTDKVVAWTICPYLVIHTLLLSALAIITWLAPDFEHFFKFIPFISVSTETLSGFNGKFLLFRQTIIAACCAGLGGGVFMTKRFFYQYAEGVEYEKGKIESLSTKEIPRFVLLPISSLIIGPISLCLLKAGSIAFSGFSGKDPIPMFTIVAVSFIMGLAYYDTLHAFCEMNKRIFWKNLNGDSDE